MLVIASPLPTNNPEKFGPRPVNFECVTTVTFLRPGYEETVKARAKESVKDMSDNEQLYNFFKSTADLYEQNVQGVRKVIQMGQEGQSMEQLLMVQHLQIATKLRNIEMKFDRVFGKVRSIIEKGNASDYGDDVEKERDRFLRNLQKMQNIQHALKLMAEQQERARKQQSVVFDPLLPKKASSTDMEPIPSNRNEFLDDLEETHEEIQEKKQIQKDKDSMSISNGEATSTKKKDEVQMMKEEEESSSLFWIAGSLIAVGLAATVFLVINSKKISASRRR